jgi:hypothetical protein
MAELVAKGEPGPLPRRFGLERFREGRFIDESVAGRGRALTKNLHAFGNRPSCGSLACRKT